MRSLAIWILCALGAASCGNGPFEIALTIELGSGVDAATRSAITTLELVATGDESYEQSIALGRAIMQTERLVYRPKPTSRLVTLTLSAEDASGHVLATGAVTVGLGPDERASATVTLEALALDAGVDVAPALTPLVVLDFEGDASDDSISLEQNGADCAIETSIVHGGQHAGYCHGTSWYELQKTFFDSTQPTLALRAWMRFDAPTGANIVNVIGYYDNASSDFVQMSIGYNGDYGAGYRGTEGYDTGPASSVSAYGDTTWRCFEVVMSRPGSIAYYIGGTQVGETLTDAIYPTSFPYFDVGIFKASEAVDGGGIPDVGVYFDDIEIATARIGCD